jgi:hypothetical protein
VSKSEVLLGRLPQRFTPQGSPRTNARPPAIAGFKDKCSVAAFCLDLGAGQIFALTAPAAFTTIALGVDSVPRPATSHQAGSLELFERLKI